MGNGQNISEMAQIHGAPSKYLRNGFTMLEMSEEFDNGLNMWEMTDIFGKWHKYLRNG